ncbi:hypothetical protein NDU88_000766 [Pleurodeles waltl]|uniref:Uncharacterized protein n=1 Tax=Pleurodeles waltl TaxID=8319 RepID=A0AAV7UQX1_PLEWA|nr:hypothetical protein NDU88_000766 [Pleurodeles waltl]
MAGRGQTTEEDGRLSPELRAVAVPRRRRGLRRSRNNHLNTCRSFSIIAQPPIREETACRRDPVDWQRISEEMA